VDFPRWPSVGLWTCTLALCLMPGLSQANAPCEGEQTRALSALHRIHREWPLRASGDPVSRYLQGLGARIVRFSPLGGGLAWHFAVVRNLAPNAFSIGGGYVFVTDGAMAFARSESEVAAILAHEIGHQLAGHFCGPEYGSSSPLFDVFAMQRHDRQSVGVGSLRQEIDIVKEQQADRIAVSILQAGGYAPRAMLDVARRLPAGDAGHLGDPRRIQSLQSLLAGTVSVEDRPSAEFQELKRVLAAEGALQ